MTAGQQRWSHYTNMKRSVALIVRNSQRGVQTIHEDEEEAFDEEFNIGGNFDAGVAPTRKESFSLVPSSDDATPTLGSRDTSLTAPLSDDDDHSTHYNVEDDDTVIGDAPDDSHDEAAPPSASTPPVPSVRGFATHYVFIEFTLQCRYGRSLCLYRGHRALMVTIPVNNRNATNDDATVITTSTMATAQVGNTATQRLSSLSGAAAP
jgi:hypothetical protein